MTRWITEPRRIALLATILVVAVIAGLLVTARLSSSSYAASAAPYRPNPRAVATPEQARESVPRPPMRAEPPSRQRAWNGPDGTQRTTGTPSMSLTFDDGPSQFTDEVLDMLDKHDIKATFCVIGSQVRSHAAQMRRIVADGHTLCNHTWSHDLRLADRTPDQIVKDLVRTNDAIHTVVPQAKVRYFRNPGGNFNHRTVSVAQNLGMVPLHWSIDSRDWESRDSKKICDLVEGNAHPGAVVLLHDGGGDRRETMKALKKLLPFLKERYELIAMP
ncbi:polysaccharide deacetylase family protein [Catenuloplanes atrovinosus]|uniref:Peptidoglycan/xylan/chitin deacetylase (PgdA/CDA1 family) n=1 Tax=Catenuloplanes atrovinosus TaxID=137266 RepID=A0AAE4C7L4_9ACTN|nr:polysaccharide deacetylase family protein [Catenuloplanes atrovinosus]MDR7274003.1 peptidoglycan/xylan/chitin deacetylase (PgdA/CDA1 family) [Catenuloplanes atrovinosus]